MSDNPPRIELSQRFRLMLSKTAASKMAARRVSNCVMAMSLWA